MSREDKNKEATAEDERLLRSLLYDSLLQSNGLVARNVRDALVQLLLAKKLTKLAQLAERI